MKTALEYIPSMEDQYCFPRAAKCFRSRASVPRVTWMLWISRRAWLGTFIRCIMHSMHQSLSLWEHVHTGEHAPPIETHVVHITCYNWSDMQRSTERACQRVWVIDGTESLENTTNKMALRKLCLEMLFIFHNKRVLA